MIRLSDIARASLLRFLPATAIGVAGITFGIMGVGIGDTPPRIFGFISGLLLCQTIGFAAILWKQRFRLESAADITGRRSVIAGALGIAGLVLSVSGQSLVSVLPYAMAIVTGAITGGITYWPWLRRRAAADEIAAWESVDVAALAGPSASFQSSHIKSTSIS